MSKRQEKPYAARIAALSKKKLAEEIGRLIALSTSEDTTEQMKICEAEDEKRGGTCYPAGVAMFNQSIGLRQTGPNQFDMREV